LKQMSNAADARIHDRAASRPRMSERAAYTPVMPANAGINDFAA